MKEQKKYFIWNKQSDFKRGYGENICYMDSGICIEKTQEKSGIFFSRVLDSKEKQTIWHRMVVESVSYGEVSIICMMYSGESEWITTYCGEKKIEEIIKDTTLTIKQKEEYFFPYYRKTIYNPKDDLLHEVKGRYLWFQMCFTIQGEYIPSIQKIKIYFPKQSWIVYLPEIYQQGQENKFFLERYLSIYQSLYEDMTEHIQSITSFLDAEGVEQEVLLWLASWFDIDTEYIWTEEQLRKLLYRIIPFYKKRGTIYYLSEMIQLYTGKKPYIVEQHKIQAYCQNKKRKTVLTNLYGDNPYIFTVIVDLKENTSTKEYSILKKIVESVKPAHMESNVILLEPYIFLDKYSYLGINSILNQYRESILDGQSKIPFIKI